MLGTPVSFYLGKNGEVLSGKQGELFGFDAVAVPVVPVGSWALPGSCPSTGDLPAERVQGGAENGSSLVTCGVTCACVRIIYGAV